MVSPQYLCYLFTVRKKYLQEHPEVPSLPLPQWRVLLHIAWVIALSHEKKPLSVNYVCRPFLLPAAYGSVLACWLAESVPGVGSGDGGVVVAALAQHVKRLAAGPHGAAYRLPAGPQRCGRYVPVLRRPQGAVRGPAGVPRPLLLRHAR